MRRKQSVIKEPETIKDLEPITAQYFNPHQLNDLRFWFFMENAPEPHRVKIEALVYGSDGNITIIYMQNKVQKREWLKR